MVTIQVENDYGSQMFLAKDTQHAKDALIAKGYREVTEDENSVHDYFIKGEENTPFVACIRKLRNIEELP